MKSLFKTLGAGILYFILSPIILAIFAIMIIYTILNIIINTFLFPIKFFSGKKLGQDSEQIRLQEAKANRKLNMAMNNPQIQAIPYPYPNQSSNYYQGNGYNQNGQMQQPNQQQNQQINNGGNNNA